MTDENTPLDTIRLEAIEDALRGCTEAQQDLFRRMYPNGPAPDQMDRAYGQIQRTLAKNSATGQEQSND